MDMDLLASMARGLVFAQKAVTIAALRDLASCVAISRPCCSPLMSKRHDCRRSASQPQRWQD